LAILTPLCVFTKPLIFQREPEALLPVENIHNAPLFPSVAGTFIWFAFGDVHAYALHLFWVIYPLLPS